MPVTSDAQGVGHCGWTQRASGGAVGGEAPAAREDPRHTGKARALEETGLSVWKD